MTDEGDKVLAIIVAAGAGRRLQAPIPKQFVDLCGQPLLLHTLRAFEDSPEVDEILLVLPEAEIENFRKALARSPCRKVSDSIGGGVERQDSVEAGLHWSRSRRPDIIMVHDGVRPFVDGCLIERVLAAARSHGAAIPALRPAETVKRGREGFVLGTLDREELYLVQTPQAFRADLLWTAFQEARRSGLRGTDEAALVEACGHPVALVEGSPVNLKITRKEDLQFAEVMLSGRIQR